MADNFLSIHPSIYCTQSGLGSVVGSISLGSTAIMGFKRKESVTPSGEIITKGIRPMLQLVIRHGEIVLQCGSNLQRNYKHSIKTDGMRICEPV